MDTLLSVVLFTRQIGYHTALYLSIHNFTFLTRLLNCLLIGKCCTCGSFTVAGAASANVNMSCGTLIVVIVLAVSGLAINADGMAGMSGRISKGIVPFSSLNEAFTAGIIAAAGMPATHHDIALAAEMLVIISAIINGTF